MPTAWLSQIPALAHMAGEIGQVLTSQSKVVALPAEARVYAPGRAPEAYLLVLDGTVRVQQVSEGGREIVLYRVTAGESCTLTTACLLGHDTYSAEAITETPVKAVAIPRATFDDLVAEFLLALGHLLLHLLGHLLELAWVHRSLLYDCCSMSIISASKMLIAALICGSLRLLRICSRRTFGLSRCSVSATQLIR